MSLRKRFRAIIAILLVLGVVVTVALHAKAPGDTETSSAQRSASVGRTEQLAESSVPGTSTAASSEPAATDVQSATSTQASDSANDHPAVDASADDSDTSASDTDIPVNAPAPDAEASPVSEELQRQANDAIPRAERPKIAPDAKYEPGVVLVTVRKGTTAAELSEAIMAAGITSVEHDDIEVVTDDLMMVGLAPDASIDDAIYDLESSGIAKSAQPNYVYEIAEDSMLASDDVELADEDATTPDDVEAVSDTNAPEATDGIEPASEAFDDAEPAPEATDDAEPASENTTTPDDAGADDVVDASAVSDEPSLAVEADATKEQGDAQPTIEAQSTSPTAARDALNDTYASSQWGLDSIDALDAWEFPPLKSATTTVGVGILDYGFGDSHEDLVDNVRSTYYVPTKTENIPVLCPPGSPGKEHGSHVAGIVAATSNNEKGISGVGFNHLKLSLLGLIEEDAAGVTTDAVVTGYDYLITHKDQYNIRVANISLGVKFDSLPTDDAILNKVDEAYGQGIVTVGSAGNQTARDIPPFINYPSDYETVIAVMNLRNADPNDPKSVSLSNKSNFNAPGETGKNISAPGTEIYSTYPSDYGVDSGTSMAAPHVAGVVGLMFVVNPTLTAPQAKSLLYSSARDIGDEGWDEKYGYGEVNAFAAVRAAAADAIAGPEYLAVGSNAAYTVASGSAGWSFSSSNPNVLALSQGGTATAQAAGTAVVSASDGNRTVAQQVTVLGPITGSCFVAKDGSEALSIAMPDGCGDLAWEWSSSDESLATVTNNGVVYGKGVGTVSIEATLVSDPSVALSHTIAVYNTVQGDVCVPAGDTAVLTPSNAGGAQISWSSANEQAVTVDQNGQVTALHAGGAAVSCTIGQGDESVTNVWLVYTYGPIEGDSSVGIGQSTQLKVAGIDQLPVELQTGWTWSLAAGSDSAVASVGEDGKVTGYKPGAVTVTASRGGGQDQASFSYDVQVTTPTLANAKVTIPRQTYSGEKLTPVPVVELNGTTLTAGTDYDVVDQDIVNVSSYNVVIQGKGAYGGKATGIFVVEPKRLKPPQAITGLVYNGQEQRGVPEGDGYSLEDAIETDADSYYAVATVTDKVNTCWENGRPTCRIDWSIAPRSLSEVSVAELDSCVYNGSEHKPKPEVTWNGMSLEVDEDYELNYVNNVNAGTATVILSGDDHGNFAGTKEIPFTIEPAPIDDAVVTLGEPLTYNEEAQTQKVVSVRLGDVDITEFCDVTDNVATNAGKYELTVSAKPDGNYKGSVTCPFSVARAAYSVGDVTAADVKESLDPADVVLTRTNTSLPGRLVITESELSYGTNTYHWTFTPDDANYEPTSGTVEVTVTGHEWGEPTYEWAEGDTSCTARRICANNPAHVEEETVEATRKVTVEPTIENEGKATLTAVFENAAFEEQAKEISLPKLPKPGKIESLVVVKGDGPDIKMSVPDGLVESMLSEEEKELVANGADALLIATVRWLGVDEVPKEDLAILAKDCKDSKEFIGWEAYLDISLHVRVGDEERRVTEVDKPLAFEVGLDPEGKDAVSKSFAQAIASGKADGSVTVRRVHAGTVDKVGSARKSERVLFKSDRFSTYALGSKAKKGTDSKPTNTSNTPKSTKTSKTVKSTKTSKTAKSTKTSKTAKLPATSDSTQPVAPIAVAGAIALALAALTRRTCER